MAALDRIGIVEQLAHGGVYVQVAVLLGSAVVFALVWLHTRRSPEREELGEPPVSSRE